MRISYNKRFLKDLAGISSKQRLKIEKFVFTDFIDADAIISSGKLEKLKGYTIFYKIRIGDYRIGIKQKMNCSLSKEFCIEKKFISYSLKISDKK